MTKTEYVRAYMEIDEFEAKDVITTSTPADAFDEYDPHEGHGF